MVKKEGNWDKEVMGIIGRWCFLYPIAGAIAAGTLIALISGISDGWGIVYGIFTAYYALLIFGTLGNINATAKIYTVLELQTKKLLSRAALYYCLIMGTYLCLLPFLVSMWFLGFLILNPATILISITIATLVRQRL